MTESNAPKQKWKFSGFGTILGIFVGLFWLGFVYVIWLANHSIQAVASGRGVTITTGDAAFVSSEFYWVLVVLLVVTKIATWIIKEPWTVKGPIRIVLGAATAVFTYLIFSGGVLSLLVAYQKEVSVNITVTVLITLGFLELSALMTVLQGALEYREGRRLMRGVMPARGPTPT